MIQYKVRERRLKLGMKQCELVRKSGVSRTVISCLENGTAADVKISTIVALAETLKCSPHRLFKYSRKNMRKSVEKEDI